MREPVGELTIEPDPLPERAIVDYEQILQVELANVAPNSGSTTLRLASAALIHLYADYGRKPSGTMYGFSAEMSGDLSLVYKKLTHVSRDNLTYEVKHAMARQSLAVDANLENYEEYYHESRVFMGNQPLFFEPFNHAMLKGYWVGRQENKLKFEALDVPSREQREILLGGFASFLTFLKQ
jgi:hypothetical protein